MTVDYSKAFTQRTRDGSFNEAIEKQAKSGRVPHTWVDAVSADYGVVVPVTKPAFLAYRAKHVKHAIAAAQDSELVADTSNMLYVKGYKKRAALYEQMDAIAAMLTGVDKMADSADWGALFAPAPRKAKIVAGESKIIPSVLDADTVAPNVMDETHDISEVSANVAVIVAGLQAGTVSMLDATALQTALTAYFKAVMPVAETA